MLQLESVCKRLVTFDNYNFELIIYLFLVHSDPDKLAVLQICYKSNEKFTNAVFCEAKP